MRSFDFNQGIVTAVIGGMVVFIVLQICLLAVGFNDHDIGKVWGALAIIWAPAFFIWGGRKSDSSDPWNSD